MPINSPVGEGFSEQLYDGEHTVCAFGYAWRSGVVDNPGIDDVVKGGNITLLYKRCIETADDGLVFFGGGWVRCT